MTSFFLLRFEKLIGFNIKNLKLYIEQDSFNKLKGVIYGMGSLAAVVWYVWSQQ
jgi:hypothetical protein